MDSDCLSLLPSVCEVLADSKLLLHDDTCLEKLLDCFKELIMQNGEQYFMQYLPCLLQFLEHVSKSQTVDPSVFTFSLKLAGLLAGKEHNFILLKERGVLDYMFQPVSWHMMELWKNSLVRYGWLHGLWSMLQHSQSINFFCKNGFIDLVLHLQNDKGFFITSLTSQILAHILNTVMPVVQSNNTESETPNCGPGNTEFVSITKAVMNHVAASLASEDQAVIIPALRLLATILTQCREPLKEMFWKHVVGPLEVLANVKNDSFTLPIIAVLQAFAQSPVLIQSDCRLETLMDIMLFSRNATESVQCAAIILQMENCPDILKWKATDVVLLPLLCVTASPLQLHEPDKLKGHILQLEKQLSQKGFCVCLLTQSLSSLAEHVYKESLADIPVQLIASSVIKLLEMCIGHCPFTLIEAGAFPHLIGCNKVQQCSIDLLGGLTIFADALEGTECKDPIEDALMILLQYLQSPDLHATVLKKTYQATLKWLNLCSPSSDLWKMVINELFQLTKKHVCDRRWEVRDSTLEFITQLTANLKGNRKYTENLHSSDMISVLFTSLSDLEGYVQASAVAALGEAVTTSDVCSNVQEKAVTHLLRILSQDTQSFPHRAAVKVFIAWLKSPYCCTALEQSISTVLLIAGNDIDWEVKVLTVELADSLMDKSLNHCPCHFQKICKSSENTCIMHALSKLKDLGLFDFLFKCIFDCDRPVSQKACSLLLKLRTFLREITTADHKVLTLDICKYSWNEEMLKKYQKNQEVIELHCVRNGAKSSCRKIDNAESLDQASADLDLCQILELLDLEIMQHTLSLSSDHVINSPQSLMEDILFMTRESEDNVADCY
ncbi:BRCA1-associated ATM activator 1 isoform X1 [Tachysurus fulvidraco]|uniref:BRCA1-associated ATM activator 1 isoform X1 n=1 Tax=Tachysurus fulvidraco TaxID=1234273 RepID=UPI001FEEECDE|nr:BRCA1-associated ATM activator 1 isoform X1 [Tachysurus fulvidraco]XP_027012119.2 BRCA1-associated ATM activator 1 isoform X1 [Tachysurus fulvidraco]XP_047659303.1 BRCA1-associated ATM activator 1 isoform X1 [Tachysurus fulvidraco]